MFKKIVSIILCLVMATSAITASAASNENAQSQSGSSDFTVFLVYTGYTSTTMSISDSGTATCTAILGGIEGTTTSANITVTLQKKVLFWWSDVHTWTTTVNNWYANFSNTYTGLGGGTYRTKAVYVVYSGSNNETVTDYTGETTH